ncbi:hypothetical protein FNW02_19065 [Komarekiella sp. 'clone 1']|uniref:Uncharacterized protein n=1 Tax=Komarekiella delphini-convector SJRDD-AB1 TaxID=2593771 RepID=A0AA40SZC9_9NOST|nr:hypothetical protein [Komarekiella delphini-convector]MBD6617870.1 hypothetical protein [Komarekiella delphini-convector SJRDD-AB1]
MLLTKLSAKYDLSNILGHEILTLRKQQDKTLEIDVKNVLSYRAWIQAKTNNIFDSTRVLGIVAATKGAENYLPYTIPKIIQQISEMGMMADIVIGLNNGFQCPSVINRFMRPDVQVIHLYTGEKTANNTPAKIFDNLMCEGKPYCLTNINFQQAKHRIFVVHQQEGQYSAGKIRVLGDVYGSLLMNSIDNGWIPPAILVTFDAESQFLIEQKYSFIEPDSNGLKLILNQLITHPEIDILGVRHKFLVYRKDIVNKTEVLVPNFNEDLPPIQWFLDIVHGRFSSFMTKPGGGTFGKSDTIISLLTVIAESYPGSRCEDSHLTILAEYAGFIGDIFVDVVATNRSPHITDMTTGKPPKKAWIEQVYRWSTSVQALKLLYGEHNIKRIVDDSLPWWLALTKQIEIFKLIRGKENNLFTVIKKLKFSIIAFLTSRQIKKSSRQNPDVLKGSRAKACW